MFWKRKRNPSQGHSFQLEWEEDRRYYFRVEPSPQEPVQLQVGTRLLKVTDISAGGLAVADPQARPGQHLAGLLRLPGDPQPLPLILEVLSLDGRGAARGPFLKIKDQDRERLHQYVLLRQKEEIELQKQLQKAEDRLGGPGGEERQ